MVSTKLKLVTVAAAGAFAALTMTTSLPAAAADAFSFSFNTGDVAMGFSDGYWDHAHHFHKWHNSREAREYRTRFADHYDSHKHTRVPNKGWRDEYRGDHREDRH